MCCGRPKSVNRVVMANYERRKLISWMATLSSCLIWQIRLYKCSVRIRTQLLTSLMLCLVFIYFRYDQKITVIFKFRELRILCWRTCLLYTLTIALQHYHDFQSNVAIFPSVVQAYTQPYSFGGRIKLIICQIRYDSFKK